MKNSLLWSGICLVIAAGGPGCASAPPTGAKVSELTHEERCVRLLRDLRLYCKDGLRDGKASTGTECLSRRLELRKLCY